MVLTCQNLSSKRKCNFPNATIKAVEEKPKPSIEDFCMSR